MMSDESRMMAYLPTGWSRPTGLNKPCPFIGNWRLPSKLWGGNPAQIDFGTFFADE